MLPSKYIPFTCSHTSDLPGVKYLCRVYASPYSRLATLGHEDKMRCVAICCEFSLHIILNGQRQYLSSFHFLGLQRAWCEHHCSKADGS